MRNRTLMVAIVLALVYPVISQSQPFQPRHRRTERNRMQIEKRIQTMKIWKMSEELELSQEQAAKFFPLMSQSDQEIDKVRKERQETIQKLEELVWKPEADAKEINQLVDQFQKSQTKEMDLRQKFIKDASSLLEPDQLGKLVLFDARFPGVVRNLVREFVDQSKKTPGPPAPEEPPEGESDW